MCIFVYVCVCDKGDCGVSLCVLVWFQRFMASSQPKDMYDQVVAKEIQEYLKRTQRNTLRPELGIKQIPQPQTFERHCDNAPVVWGGSSPSREKGGGCREFRLTSDQSGLRGRRPVLDPRP